MNDLQAETALLTQFRTGWAPLHPSDSSDPNYVPYCYRNERFTTSDLGALGCWARIDIQHTTREQMTMGRIADELAGGNVFVQLFGPLDEGSAKLLALASDVRTALARKRLDDLNTRVAETRTPIEDPVGGWLMLVVVVAFEYEQQTTSG